MHTAIRRRGPGRGRERSAAGLGGRRRAIQFGVTPTKSRTIKVGIGWASAFAPELRRGVRRTPPHCICKTARTS